jgi:hypothetical protein
MFRRLALRLRRTSKVTVDDQWHRIRFSKTELRSGIWNRFWVDGLLPVAKRLGKVDFNTIAIFDMDDIEGGKYLYLSPGASSAFLPVARAHGGQPCVRPAPEGLSLAYGEDWAAQKLLLR